MNRSPFEEIQRRHGAEFAEAEGWILPAHYGDPRAEHAAARERAAVVDRSAAGRIKVTGRDRLALLHRLCTQHLTGLVRPGHGAPAVFTTNKGRIVDLALVLDRGESLLLVTSPARRQALPEWVRRYILTDDVALTDETAETGAFRVTGPLAGSVLQALGEVPVAAIEPHRIAGLSLSGIEAAVIGEPAGPRPSYLIVAGLPGAIELFDAAVQAARAAGGGPAGERARAVLRVEDGLPEAGAELTEDYNPWEARLDAAISLDKGCYIGQEVVARLNTYDKVSKRLAGLRLGAAEPPGPGGVLRAGADGPEVGVLTSAVRSFATGETIGLGYVRVSHGEPGTPLLLAAPAGADPLPATVAALPVVP